MKDFILDIDSLSLISTRIEPLFRKGWSMQWFLFRWGLFLFAHNWRAKTQTDMKVRVNGKTVLLDFDEVKRLIGERVDQVVRENDER